MAKVRPPSLYYGTVRAGTMQDIQYTIVTNDGHEVCDAGTFFTDGVAQGKVSCTLLVPSNGVGFPIVDDALLHKDVTLRVGIVNGKIHKLDARVTQIEFTGKFADGVHQAKAEFMTKTPQVA